jgi:hypothetical protein
MKYNKGGIVRNWLPVLEARRGGARRRSSGAESVRGVLARRRRGHFVREKARLLTDQP